MGETVSLAEVLAWIRQWGALAPAVAFVLFAVQAMLPLFPYLLLAAAAGTAFGFPGGFLLAWLGALTGASMAYLACRWVGRDWLVGYVRGRFEVDLEAVDPRYGFWGILAARLFPVVPTPVINAAAGAGGVPFRVFLLSSAVGKLPTALIYSGIGYHLSLTGNLARTLVLLAAAIAASGSVLLWGRRRRWGAAGGGRRLPPLQGLLRQAQAGVGQQGQCRCREGSLQHEGGVVLDQAGDDGGGHRSGWTGRP
ncbi:MAG: TVP38/TMEM64 family protein, partial [Syntrophomonadaceae bacterium]|nr:TVP38/TMEM64 family protein [Syntrophomonadaceae bacterium]